MSSTDTCDRADVEGDTGFDGCGMDGSMEGGREQGGSVVALEEDNAFD
jgi:hypothetical protein